MAYGSFDTTVVAPEGATTTHAVVYRSPAELIPYKGNARIHDERQIAALMAAIKEFGFRVPILVNEDSVILAGHGRVEAAKRLLMTSVPTIIMSGLTKAQQRAYVLADNKLAQMSKWDGDILRDEIKLLLEDNFHIEVTGFTTAETDIIIDGNPEPNADDPDELQQEDVPETVVSRQGDLWLMDKHRLFCGDALKQDSYATVIGEGKVELFISDPPYNVPVNGHVCGSGKTKHDDFAMAAGEMSPSEFESFLKTALSIASECMQDGAIIFCFMDWRHQRELLNAAEPMFGPLRQLCVWVKDNGGMGTFYRSQHELVFVFKKGKAKHINNFKLGEHGRYRTNVWQYPGVNTFKGKGHELLKLHPTVKPASLIADAIRDCSNRNGVVLDPFAGSGTILIAAERTGRCARAIEFEPKYVDVAIKRWERVTGQQAVHAQSGLTWSELMEIRNAEKEKKDGE